MRNTAWQDGDAPALCDARRLNSLLHSFFTDTRRAAPWPHHGCATAWCSCMVQLCAATVCSSCLQPKGSVVRFLAGLVAGLHGTTTCSSRCPCEIKVAARRNKHVVWSGAPPMNPHPKRGPNKLPAQPVVQPYLVLIWGWECMAGRSVGPYGKYLSKLV